jgi:hypothetical protein
MKSEIETVLSPGPRLDWWPDGVFDVWTQLVRSRENETMNPDRTLWSWKLQVSLGRRRKTKKALKQRFGSSNGGEHTYKPRFQEEGSSVRIFHGRISYLYWILNRQLLFYSRTEHALLCKRRNSKAQNMLNHCRKNISPILLLWSLEYNGATEIWNRRGNEADRDHIIYSLSLWRSHVISGSTVLLVWS